MKSFSASYRNEWAKLVARKKYVVMLCISLIFCIIWAMLGHLFPSYMMAQGGFSSALTPAPMSTLPIFLHFLIPFLMFMGATDLITVEGADNTMKAMVFRPVERWKLYFSKILAVMAYAAVYLACLFIVSAVLDQTLGKQLSLSELSLALASYVLSLVPLAILASFAAFVALLGRSGSLTMFLLLLLYFLLNVLPVFFPVLNEMLFTSYLGWYRIWIGTLPSASNLVRSVAIVLGYGVVFLTAGSLVYDRKGY